MADRFLSRPESKQRILRIDLSGVRPKNESALVVTAELRRLSYFQLQPDGTWTFATREHDPLGVVAIGPNDTGSMPWSRRNGVAAEGRRGAVVFKRSVGNRVGLFVDVLDLAAGGPRLAAQQPIPIPLDGLGFVASGIDVWAWILKEQLFVVTQGWVRAGLRGIGTPPKPKLILLRASLGANLEDRGSWTTLVLDDGGFDLDARFENGRVWVVHRRQGEAISLDIQPLSTSNDTVIWVTDTAQSFAGIDLSSLAGDLPPLVIVSCDPLVGDVRTEADDLPGLERPQLQRIDPVIVTGDRMRGVQVHVRPADGHLTFTPEILQSEKWVLWRFRGRWLSDSVADSLHSTWPLNLEEIAGSQWMVDVAGDRLRFGSLASPRPMSLVSYEEGSKGRVLGFIEENAWIGGVVTDYFAIVPINNGAGERLRWQSRNVLDVGHEAIRRMPDDEGNHTLHPAEHTQFLPFFIDTTASKPDGDKVVVRFGGPRRTTGTRNTLGGLVVADQELRTGLVGYVGMDDGGGRVMASGDVTPIPPTTTTNHKALPPEIVVGTGSAGSAWVELPAADWIDATLPGYFVPYSDFFRTLPASVEPLFFALVILPVEILFRHFTPRSLGSGSQLMLDALPIAALLAPGNTLSLDDVSGSSFSFDQTVADGIQAAIAAQAGESNAFRSTGGPFTCSFTFSPGAAQVGNPLTFSATATTTSLPVTFSWSLTPPPIPAPPGPPIPVPAIPGTGQTLPFTFTTSGDWTIALVATAADGSSSTATSTISVSDTLWDQVWTPQSSISNDLVTVGSTTLQMSQYSIEYGEDGQGNRTQVTINSLPTHRAFLRFQNGVDGQQGRIRLRLPVTISSRQASFTGMLAGVLKLNSIDVSLRYERSFTIGVSTSDRRSVDIASGRSFASIDSRPGARSTARASDVETIRQLGSPDQLRRMTPSAISARPVDRGEVGLTDVRLDTELSDPLGGIVTIFSVILVLGIAGPLLGPLVAAIALGAGPLLPVVGLVGLGLLALVVIALGLGLGRLLRNLARSALTSFATDAARSQISTPESLASIRKGLDGAGLMTYAGEGISESIAIQAVRKAITDGHAVPPVAHDQQDPQNPGQMLKATGRERFRNQCFETVVVGDGLCRVLLRVP